MALWYKKLHRNKIKRNPKHLLKRDGVKRYKKFKHVLHDDIKEEFEEIYIKIIKLFNGHPMGP